jgi:hypothetical protein
MAQQLLQPASDFQCSSCITTLRSAAMFLLLSRCCVGAAKRGDRPARSAKPAGGAKRAAPADAELTSPLSTASTVSATPSSIQSELDRSDSAISFSSMDSDSASIASIRSVDSGSEEPQLQLPPPALRLALNDITNTLQAISLPPAEQLTKETRIRQSEASPHAPLATRLAAQASSHPAPHLVIQLELSTAADGIAPSPSSSTTLPLPFSMLTPASLALLSYEHHCALFACQTRLQHHNPQAEYIIHRPLLLTWLLECCDAAFALPALTTYSAVGLFDYLSSSCPISRSWLQLIALTSVLLASKFHDVDGESALTIARLLSYMPGLYSREQMQAAELWCLQRLGWNVDVITAQHFIIHFQQPATLAIILLPSDLAAVPAAATSASALPFPLAVSYEQRCVDLLRCCDFLLHLCLLEYSSTAFPPALLAAAVLTGARVALGLPAWHAGVSTVVGYAEEEVADCRRYVLTLYDNWLQREADAMPDGAAMEM